MPDPLARASVEPSPDASTSADASVCIPAPGSETHLNTHPLAKIDKSGTILTLTLTPTQKAKPKWRTHRTLDWVLYSGNARDTSLVALTRSHCKSSSQENFDMSPVTRLQRAPHLLASVPQTCSGYTLLLT